MICPQCKSGIPDNAQKCRYCGSKVGWMANLEGLQGCGCLLLILGIIGVILWLFTFGKM